MALFHKVFDNFILFVFAVRQEMHNSFLVCMTVIRYKRCYQLLEFVNLCHLLYTLCQMIIEKCEIVIKNNCFY